MMKGGKNHAALSEKDRADLSAFLSQSVPKPYFELDGLGKGKIDFHYNYEEIYDYADALLRGEEIDLSLNFLGVKSSAANEEFRNLLEVVARRNPAMEQFCDLFRQAISIVLRAAKSFGR